VRANMAMFSEALRLFTPFAGGAGLQPNAPSAAPTPPPAADDADDLGELRRQVSEMQARLDRIGKD